MTAFWIVFGLVAAAVLFTALSRRDAEQSVESAAFEAVVTHVEDEYARHHAPPRTEYRRLVITFRRDDGTEGELAVPMHEARRAGAGHLLSVRPGDRIVKDADEAWPRLASPPAQSRWVKRAIAWRSSGDPDEPYVAEVDGRSLRIRANTLRHEPPYSVLVDGELDGDVPEWPDVWKRPPEEEG